MSNKPRNTPVGARAIAAVTTAPGAWQRRERDAARTLCTRRVVRARGESAPDLEPITLPSGETLQPEIKHRKRLPRLLADALAQALRYAPTAVPLAVVSERGGRQLACLYLHDLARLLGFAAPTMPRERRKRAPKPTPSQPGLFGGDR